LRFASPRLALLDVAKAQRIQAPRKISASGRLGRRRSFTKVPLGLYRHIRLVIDASRNSKLVIARCTTSCTKPASWRRQSCRSDDHLASERGEYVGCLSRLEYLLMPSATEVVADARQNFASSNVSLLPPLPVAPGPQTRRPSRDRSHGSTYNSSRPSRTGFAANQIFHREEDTSADQSYLSSATSAHVDDRMSAVSDASPGRQPEGPTRSAFSFDSPRPTRRATVLGRSPEQSRSLDMDVDMTPSKRREKSKSANDLKRLIRPISKVQLELDKRE